jgi:diguanylate cyclase (GGDEF)-like protein
MRCLKAWAATTDKGYRGGLSKRFEAPRKPMSATTTSKQSINRTRLVLAAAVLVISVAVWIVSETQRNTAERVFEQSRAADAMLTAMLDQETGLRGFAISGKESFLEPYVRGAGDFDDALVELRERSGDGPQQATIFSMVRAARRWQGLGDDAIRQVRRHGRLNSAEIVQRKDLFDQFRTQSRALDAELTTERNKELDRAGRVSVFVIVGLGLGFGIFGFTMVERETRAARKRRAGERAYRSGQSEFAETMQVMRDEPEAHSLVKEHLERTIAGSKVVVLNRNNSDNRLIASTECKDDPVLAEKLVDAEPESCLAVRLGREYEQGATSDPLLKCDLCGVAAAEIVCTPSLVGGEVIGSVLVRNERPLDADERHRITDSVSQAAPVLANLRNLAIAENRAATDALTGLPNTRSCRDNLKRMVAHAGRTVAPLSVVLFDLDHFKRINDRFGHGAGDDVLAAIGEVVRSTFRTSDFGGRYGGEEFLLLLPSTDQVGALDVTEKLRRGIEALEFQQPELDVTASFGIATYPLDALDADSLVRMADRALYAAKANGRNRVELITAEGIEADRRAAASRDA